MRCVCRWGRLKLVCLTVQRSDLCLAAFLHIVSSPSHSPTHSPVWVSSYLSVSFLFWQLGVVARKAVRYTTSAFDALTSPRAGRGRDHRRLLNPVNVCAADRCVLLWAGAPCCPVAPAEEQRSKSESRNTNQLLAATKLLPEGVFYKHLKAFLGGMHITLWPSCHSFSVKSDKYNCSDQILKWTLSEVTYDVHPKEPVVNNSQLLPYELNICATDWIIDTSAVFKVIRIPWNVFAGDKDSLLFFKQHSLYCQKNKKWWKEALIA